MDKDKCPKCKFWQRDGSDGICRKNAPSPGIIKEGGPYILVWPRTNDKEWCSEFKPFKVKE